MAVKDISPVTIANILVLIATATNFAFLKAQSSKSYKEIPFRISKTISPSPSAAAAELKRWYETYVKFDAPAAGTATISSSTSTSIEDWTSNFFVVRTELLPNLSPDAIAKLDDWWKKYTTYKVTGHGKW